MAEVIEPGHAIAGLAAVSLLVSAALTRPLIRATQPRPDKPHHPAGTVVTTTNTRRS